MRKTENERLNPQDRYETLRDGIPGVQSRLYSELRQAEERGREELFIARIRLSGSPDEKRMIDGVVGLRRQEKRKEMIKRAVRKLAGPR